MGWPGKSLFLEEFKRQVSVVLRDMVSWRDLMFLEFVEELVEGTASGF